MILSKMHDIVEVRTFFLSPSPQNNLALLKTCDFFLSRPEYSTVTLSAVLGHSPRAAAGMIYTVQNTNESVSENAHSLR